jgi:signal transduction histidine kinase
VTSLQLSISCSGCVAQLALALVALRRSVQSILGLPLALLFLDIFVWNLASLLYDLSGQLFWNWLDHSASPLTAPLAVEFILAFVGQQRRFARCRILCWVPFALLSMIPTLGLSFPTIRHWDQDGAWAAALAICAVPIMTVAIALLVSHLHQVTDPQEKARTRLVLAAAALGTTLCLTDLLCNFIHDLPSLGALGALATGAVLMFAVTRENLLDSRLTIEAITFGLGLAGGAGVVACLVRFRLLASQTGLLVLATGIVTLTLVLVVRQLARGAEAKRVRTRELATLGRFAAQMAHDFKNPLAALKGAAQFLKEDLSNEQRSSRRATFVDLMLDQIDRLDATITVYQRLARIEPARAKMQINQLVQEVMTLQEFALSQRIALNAELADSLPSCNADSGLLANALQNLIRNACEAITGDSVITVRTTPSEASEPLGVVVSVEDTGAGMDARTCEHAFDEFFTTKPKGSGLGLSFVRRVVEAHGGMVSIASHQGRGTVVRILLPLG